MKKLRIPLAVIQILSFGALVAVTELAPGGGRGAGPGARNWIMAAFLGSIIVSAVLSGMLAAGLRRAVPVWVIGSIFIPFLIPFILAFMKEAPDTSYVAPERSVPGSPRDESASGLNEQGFCARCVSETTEESPGSVSTTNGIGTALQGTRWREKGLDPCPVCGSVVQQKWYMFGWGVKPLGTYRILYVKEGIFSKRYFGRRLKADPVQRKASIAGFAAG